MTTKQSYRDNPKLKRVGVQINYTEEQVLEYRKCAKDPIYFAKYINIVSLDHGIIPFDMYDFQKEMIKTFHENRFVIVKCPRQVGKTTTAVAASVASVASAAFVVAIEPVAFEPVEEHQTFHQSGQAD